MAFRRPIRCRGWVCKRPRSESGVTDPALQWQCNCGYDAPMTRIVGHRDRSELIPDPAEALRRGRMLDAWLASIRIPRLRGVIRATHRAMNQADDARQLAMARRLNQPR